MISCVYLCCWWLGGNWLSDAQIKSRPFKVGKPPGGGRLGGFRRENLTPIFLHVVFGSPSASRAPASCDPPGHRFRKDTPKPPSPNTKGWLLPAASLPLHRRSHVRTRGEGSGMSLPVAWIDTLSHPHSPHKAGKEPKLHGQCSFLSGGRVPRRPYPNPVGVRPLTLTLGCLFYRTRSVSTLPFPSVAQGFPRRLTTIEYLK